MLRLRTRRLCPSVTDAFGEFWSHNTTKSENGYNYLHAEHGRKSRGDASPQNLEQGDANNNCPPRFRRLLSDLNPARPT